MKDILSSLYGPLTDRFVFVVSPEGKIIYVNDAAISRLHILDEGLEKNKIDQIIVPISEGSGWNALRKHLEENKAPFVGDLHVFSGTGSLSLLRASAFRSNLKGQEIIIILFQDISTERAYSRKMEQKNHEMAKLNAELIRSNKELKKTSEVKTKFLSIASHELKTPLTSIKGYAEILIDNMADRLDPAAFRMIGNINRAADRLHSVINSMLDVTRIEQNRLRLKPEKISLKSIAEECIGELSQFSDQRNIRFIFTCEDGLPLFYGDKMRMAQVFTNLFSNALKYSKNDSLVDVSIVLEPFVEGDRFHIVVRDHGIGIDKDELEKVFEPFYEVGDTSRHSTGAGKFMGGGTGLGLSIVKGVVERHGGTIWAESDGTLNSENPGTQFHFILPKDAEIKWNDDETQEFKLKRIIADHVKKEVSEDEVPVILLIDDDEEAVEITRMVLGDKYRLITAENGEEGIRKTYKYNPSLILIDLYLPGLDGCQVSRILRSQEETQDIPIAFFSAATQNEEVERCFASGADEFIVKPFKGSEMEEKVSNLVRKRVRAVPLRP